MSIELHVEVARLQAAVNELAVASVRNQAEITALRAALKTAEAALSDIGDADREPGDDMAWCERRAAEHLPEIRAVLKCVA